MPVAQASATAFEKNELFAVLGYLTYDFARFGIFRNRAERYGNHYILGILAR